MTITLAQLHSLDFGALWASLPPEAQARIGVMAIRYEFASQVAQDGGFATTSADREEADAIATAALNAAPEATWAAFPALLPIDHDDLYPCWQVIGDPRGQPVPAVKVRGLAGTREPVGKGCRWFVRVRGALVELAGARNIVSRADGVPPVWQFWTVPQVEAERHRRHPDIAARETAEAVQAAREAAPARAPAIA